MATYATTVVIDQRAPERISKTNFILTGSVTIGTYSQTAQTATSAEYLKIAKYFKTSSGASGGFRVFCHGVTSTGYLVMWDQTNKKFKCFNPTAAQAAANTAGNAITVNTGSATASAVDATTPTIAVPSGFRSAVAAAPGSEAAETIGAVGTFNFMAIGLGS